MRPDEIDATDVYYFGVWGQPGHSLYNVHHQGMTLHVTNKELPEFLHPSRLDQVYCRNLGAQWVGNEAEGIAYLHYLMPGDDPFTAQKWSILAFADRSGERRNGSNSAFIAKGVFEFQDMVMMARVKYPALYKRMADHFFEIVDVRKIK